ncbi:RRP12-like protein [Eriocheir sinensis]|uniref:RRP12-like protein n=1 Tax=Eriocheir sinensis TaxID=95602 RepID=UPI0021C8D2C6|nr:RRP12-like protein [Eriocheir sinensis]
MAKMRMKKTSAKGHKWKKGQSCLSNPETSKHRKAARGCFFQPGNSNLTQAAIAEHNEAMREGRASRQMKELEVDEDDLRSGCGKTFNTFATNFSTCTLPAFEKFFRTFDAGSDQHTRMLGIHAAAQEYLRETGTPESSTAYYCSLMVTLEGVRGSEEDTAAALALLARVARRVARDVLRAKFAEFSATLIATLKRYGDSNNSRLVANAIGSLSVLLRAQDRSEWTNPSTLDLFNSIMAYNVHPKPKIRKAAQYNTCAILWGSAFILCEAEAAGTTTTTTTAETKKEEEEEDSPKPGASMTTSAAAAAPRHPAAGAAAEFCLVNLRAATELGNTKTALHTLVLLRQVIASLPRKQLKAVCECLLSIMQVGRALVNTCALQALHALFAAHPPPEVLPAHTNAALVAALTQGATGGAGGVGGVPVPGKNDPQPACAWITVVTVAVMNMCRLEEEAGMGQLLRWFEVLVPYWQSDHASVRTKVRESLDVLLRECVVAASEGVRGGAAEGLWAVVCEGLSLQYQAAWGEVFRVLEAAFPALGPARPAAAQPCLASLCQLMANPRLPQRPALERAVGAAVAALGPESLLALVPPRATGDVEQDEGGWWTLPLLRRFVAAAGLGPFLDHLLPLAARCHALLDGLDKQGRRDSLLAATYRQVEQQVWAALPAFCRGAGDVEEALGRDGFPRLLCDHLKHRPDTRPHVMEALRLMLAAVPPNPPPGQPPPRLALYAKNYLPALFNVYLTVPGVEGVAPGQRQAALATVRAFAAVLEPPRAAELLAMVLGRHTQAVEAGAGPDHTLRRRALLDLAAALLPRLDGPALATLYGHVLPLLDYQEHGLQKAAYRLLEAVLAGETPATAALVEERLEELGGLLLGGLAKAAPSARAPRLRCLRLLLLRLGPEVARERREEVLRRVVGEAVVCCGRAMSQATRKAAFLLVSEVGAAIQRSEGCTAEDTVVRALELLLAGLVGSPALAAATMLALTALTYQYREQLTAQVVAVLVQNTCVQLLCPSREIVASCLSFIKALPALLTPARLAPHLPAIVQAMTNMTPDCQRKYRLKTRDILDRLMRRYGADAIAALVPPGDTILHKRIRNLRKLASRKEREREERRRTEGEEEEEEDGLGSRALPASLDEILAEIDSEEDEKEEEEEEEGGKRRKMMKKKKKKGNTWIREDDDEIVDLLDASAGQAIMSGRAAAAAARGGGRTKARAGRGFEMDKESGKLIITENGKKEKDGGVDELDFTEDMDDILGLKGAAGGSGKVKKRKRSDSLGSADGAADAGGGGEGKGAKRKKRADPGAEFRAKRAGGDVKKRGTSVNPYAYVRLSKQQLNRRKKAKFEGQFGSLVRGARKGVAGGKRKGGRKK